MLYIYKSSGNNVTTTKARKSIIYKKRTSRKMFVIIIMIIAIILISLFLPCFNVTNIEVKGISKVSKNDIITASGINTNVNIFKIDINNSKDNVMQNPYVEDMQIKRILPNKILITIQERKSVGYVYFMGAYILIDKNGYVLEVVSNVNKDDLFSIIGLKFDRFKLGKKIQVEDEEKLDIIVYCVNKLINAKLLDKISQIDVHDIDNIQLIAKNDILAKMGDISKIGYKLDYFKNILDNLDDSEKGYIDLSNLDTNNKVIFTPLQ